MCAPPAPVTLSVPTPLYPPLPSRAPFPWLTPPPRQEELEFAIMRIEALKLARQIALAARSRQDAKVPVRPWPHARLPGEWCVVRALPC